jgi:hypothetical protein
LARSAALVSYAEEQTCQLDCLDGCDRLIEPGKPMASRVLKPTDSAPHEVHQRIAFGFVLRHVCERHGQGEILGFMAMTAAPSGIGDFRFI